MKSNLISRIMAIAIIVTLTAIGTTAQAQRKRAVVQNSTSQLLTTGKAATLRSKLLAAPGCTLGRQGVSDKQTFTANGKAVTYEIASQFFNTKLGEVEQVSVLITEGVITKELDFVQYPDDKFSILDDSGELSEPQPPMSAAEACILGLGGTGSDANCDLCESGLIRCIEKKRLSAALACLAFNYPQTASGCLFCKNINYLDAINCALTTH